MNNREVPAWHAANMCMQFQHSNNRITQASMLIDNIAQLHVNTNLAGLHKQANLKL